MSNIWTAAALSQDVQAGMAIPAQLGNQDLVIWRSASGKISAWEDRCPHRGMRLSHGFVRGEFLSCIYHGWRYGDGGQCHKIPAHPELEPPSAIKVPRFAVREVSGVIWVASEGEASEPPEYAGFTGFRSVSVQVGLDVLSKALGAAAKSTLGACEVVALAQPLSGDMCNLHVLAPVGSSDVQLDNLSGELEAFRARLEKAEVAA